MASAADTVALLKRAHLVILHARKLRDQARVHLLCPPARVLCIRNEAADGLARGLVQRVTKDLAIFRASVRVVLLPPGCNPRECATQVLQHLRVRSKRILETLADLNQRNHCDAAHVNHERLYHTRQQLQLLMQYQQQLQLQL